MTREQRVAGAGTRPDAPVEDREVLARAHALLEPTIREHVLGFYETLVSRPGPQQVLARLTAEERESLVTRQAEHVLRVLDPSVSHEELLAGGRRMGTVHARAGVEMDWYVDAVVVHQRRIFEVLLGDAAGLDPAHAASVLNDRFMADLQGALRGYGEAEQRQAAALMAVTRATAEARTVADLARGVMEALVALDGVVVAFIGRPDPRGVFVFEGGAGSGVDEFIARAERPGSLLVTASASSALGQGPSGRAWRSGAIVRSDDYRADETTAPWREWSYRWGWRSSVAVPLRDAEGGSSALLSLYASVPGYFGYPSRTDLLERVQGLVERALLALEASPAVASDVRSHAERVRHQHLVSSGCVEMHYQPVVDLHRGAVAKLEALARLRDGSRLYSPAEFLPALGDEELLLLFREGLDQALRAVDLLDRDGVHVGMSVNLPPAAVTDNRYAAALATALAAHPVEADRLTLELLETSDVVGTLEQRRAAMAALKALGVRLAQDDLGSGYSSLLRLRHFPFDEVKVDRHLVAGTAAVPRAALNFVPPIIDMARSMGMSVVLEGLQSEGLVEAAAMLGADGGQGFALALPMPLHDVVPWVRGFRLEVDRDRPRTALGALAAHVAREHCAGVVASYGAAPGRPGAPDAPGALAGCPLTRYLETHDVPVELASLHREVHELATTARGSVSHREAWDRLVAMLGADA